jgi:hypothetical protein
MLIALLAVLGVDLGVLLVLLGFLLLRKRWVAHQPGAFHGAIRLVEGELEHLSPKWRRGYGRWVRDVFVWTKAPFLFRNELLPVDGVGDQRTAEPGEVKHVGDDLTVVRLTLRGAVVEVASGDGTAHLSGPFPRTLAASEPVASGEGLSEP